MSKMNWLIEAHKNGTVDYEIANTGRKHGAISKPTGSGKSSLFINDIIYRILHKGDKKLMVNISTPIIKLCEQQGNDIMATIEGVAEFYGINLNSIAYFINNSGDTDAYGNNESGLFTFNNKSFEKNFLNHSGRQIAIVVSCHPSLAEHLIPWVKKNDTSSLDVVTYIDEAHTVSSKVVSKDEDETEMDLKSLCEKSNTYLISATNKKELVEIVNSFDEVYNDSYIIMETPAEAIQANKICSPKVHIKQTVSGEIDAQICVDFMGQVNKDGNVHKVLVSCKDTKQLRTLKRDLIASGYTVFSTCSAEGMNGVLEMEDNGNKFNDVIGFIKAIDEYDKSCFVLHIRQMISGIDVSSLSDCIIQKNDTNNYNSYSTVIQTIGRSLRLGKERGIDVENRTKKHANVLFITSQQNESIYFNIEFFLINYYGHGKYEFHIGYAGNKFSANDNEVLENDPWTSMFNSVYYSNETVNYWENIKTNIRNYILTKVKPIFDGYVKLGLKIDRDIEKQIDLIEQKYHENLNGVYIFKYTQNKDLRMEVENLISDVLNYKMK